MRWIIFALSLGAAVPSIIQGVFMIFGLLSMPAEGAGIDMPALIMASLPIAAAVFALIGGCIACNESRWGALFLVVATGLCAFASREIWIYGGLCLLAALLCFFLRRHSDYDEYDYSDSGGGYDDDYEEDDMPLDDYDDVPTRSTRDYAPHGGRTMLDDSPMMSDTLGSSASVNMRTPRRMSKTCPACGATVAVLHRFCPNCGEPLHVPNETEEIFRSVVEPKKTVASFVSESSPAPSVTTAGIVASESSSPEPLLTEVSAVKDVIKDVIPDKAPLQVTSETVPIEPEPENMADLKLRIENTETNATVTDNGEAELRIRPRSRRVLTPDEVVFDDPNENEGLDNRYEETTRRISPTMRKIVRPDRSEQSRRERKREREQPYGGIDPDMSYKNFSKYTDRRKKRRRTSLGRKIFSLLLLFGAVGGALWFLLGLRKLPEDELPQFDRPKPTVTVPEVARDNLVQPVAHPEPIAVTVAPTNELPAFTPVLTPKRGLISGSNVNLRENHTTDSRSVGRKMSTNTSMEILDSWEGQSKNLTGIWYRVRLGDGREGWVYGRYVQPIGEPLPSGYTNALLRTYGGDRTTVVNTLGQPTRSTATTMEWNGLSMTFRGEQVSRLRLTSSQRELRNGLKPGMSQAVLTQKMGYPSSSKQRQVQYSEGSMTGLTIQLDANGVIREISVNEVQ